MRTVLASPPPPDATPDDGLLERWRDGDRSAGHELITRHFSCVYRFFATKVGDAAADLTQRTFLGCIESRDRFDPGRNSSFRSYLLGIAHKFLLRHFHEVGRDGRLPVGTAAELDLPASPTRDLAVREHNLLVGEALRRVPLEFQVVLELHYFAELKVTEIGETLGISTGTVKSRLHRGRRILRRCLRKSGLRDPLLGDGIRATSADHSTQSPGNHSLAPTN